MTNLEHIQTCSKDELAEILISFRYIGCSPADTFFTETYCENCDQDCDDTNLCKHFNDSYLDDEFVTKLWLDHQYY